MELQGLQEALKVEIQCHQDGELKQQLHERHARIAALSEKQKLAMRGCPVGNTKPLSLIRPPGQSIAISVVPAKTPVSMVTTHVNGQKATSPEPLQTGPVNLQTQSKTTGAGLHPVSRRVGELPQSQVLSSLSAVPLKVPQVSSLHRLAGQPPTVLPQVRPKTLIPDSLPHSPCQEQQSSQPASLQKSPSLLSSKSQAPGPALPTANSTFSSESSPPPPAVSTPAGSAGVAYAIITASPSRNPASESVTVQPLLFSTDSKVIIIQPQAPESSQNAPGVKANGRTQEATPIPSPPAKKKREEDPEKVAFMVALGLVTVDHLEEIQSKRQERKRRSTANPAYSSLFEPERKRHPSHYLNSSLFLTARDEDLCWKEELEHDEYCAVCKEDGDLQPCHSCCRAYHPDCIQPPFKPSPKGTWMCPKCQKKVLNKDKMPWPHNFVQSYVTHKTVREEEKRKLLRRNSQLKKERTLLEEQDQQLSKLLSTCMDVKSSLLSRQKETQASLERLKSLVRLIQRDQMIQVTMTATTTTGASLLSLPWIKPTIPLQKSASQSRGDD